MSRNANRTARRNARRTLTAINMDRLTFGVELETEGLDRCTLAHAVASALGSEAEYVGGGYDKWTVVVPGTDGIWSFVRDGSLANGGCEVVSPVCKLADMPMVQSVVRAVRAAGAHVNERTGMHIHIGCLEAAEVARLATTVRRNEDMMFRAFGVSARRQATYCRPVSAQFVTALGDLREVTSEKLAKAWYETQGEDAGWARREHYNGTRYHGLNLHSWFYRGTVEFRYFEGTLHAGVVRAMVTFCLALAAYAQVARNRGGREATGSAADNTRMGRLIRRLGLKDETVLGHLCSRIGGRPRTAATAEAA